MTPARPRESLAVRTDSGKRIEVISFGDGLRLSRAVGRHCSYFIDRLVATFVTFPYADNRAAVGRDLPVRVTNTRGRRRLFGDRPQRSEAVLSIKALVLEVGKANRVAVDEVRSPAILMSAAARVKRGGNGIG